MGNVRGWFAGAVATAVVASSFVASVSHAGERHVVGRVAVQQVDPIGSERLMDVRDIVMGRYQPDPTDRTPKYRVMDVNPDLDNPGKFLALIYDYSDEKAFEVVLDDKGAEIGRETVAIGEWHFNDAEFRDAEKLIAEMPEFAEKIRSGAWRTYPPMPPIHVNEAGHRLVNVGIIENVQGEFDPTSKRFNADVNEIVSISMADGKLTRWPDGAPELAQARGGVQCGGANQASCSRSSGTGFNQYSVSWPADNPVWEFKVARPEDTDYDYSLGTGIELTDVYYNGRLILKKVNMPILNVRYVSGCGPYRDWLNSENCFQAAGTTVVPGIKVGTPSDIPATTICDVASDAGNFNGVYIHDDGTYLTISSELDAGWYRYVMRYRFAMNGTIEPIFGFGDVINSCVCIQHTHHAYWRFEWAIDGDVANAATGITTLERRTSVTPEVWEPIGTEGKFYRPSVSPGTEHLRIMNPTTGNGYRLLPGKNDGEANGDSYAKGDYWVVTYNADEEDDNSPNTTANIDRWVNSEAIGTTKRTVLWYHAEFFHDQVNNIPPVGQCGILGPTLQAIIAAPPSSGDSMIVK